MVKLLRTAHFFTAVARIASMSRSELADRTRQEIRKRIDAIVLRLGGDFFDTEVSLAINRSGRFFFCPEHVPRVMELLRDRMPEQVEVILKRAEKIRRHHFDLLGYEDLNYGSEIDWHLDLVHDKRAPRDLWFKIPYLDFATVGDVKVTWELNRHQHLVTLAKAYRLTNDIRVAQELMDQWRHWQRENPYPYGINWASSLEVAFRCLSWLWVYFLLERTPAMTVDFRKQWLAAIARSARHIELYLSTYFSPNTHLLGEGIALFFIGTLCPELSSALRWQQRGHQIVLQASEQQVRPDGFYFEQSTYYHVYAIDFFIHAVILASLNGMPFPTSYHRTVERMLDSLAVFCWAGTPPRWGDDDGGRCFDSRRNRGENLRDPLATGAALFRRGDFKYLAGGVREEMFWLLGEQGIAEFDRIEATPPDMRSVALPAAGLFVQSSSEEKLQAVVDAGPQGALAAGHGHADALSLTLHADGQELLTDAGTCEYVGAAEDRKEFRVTAAHNTLEIDSRSQSEPKGPFAWQHLTNAKTETWIAGRSFDLLIASHDGYSRPDNSLIHRRCVFFAKPKFWLVRDLVLGSGEHKLDIRWHLSPHLSKPIETEGGFICSGDDVGIGIFCPVGQTWSKVVDQAHYSPVYGIKQVAFAVRFSTVATLPIEFVTLLAPIRTPRESILDKDAILNQAMASSNTSAYHFAENGEEHSFIFSSDENWVYSGWKSDAQFMYSRSHNGELSLLVLCNSTFVEFKGKRIISFPKRLQCCEIVRHQGEPQVLCSEDNILLSEDALIQLFNTRGVLTRRTGGVDC
jgi:uncharacterized heparinase superfamily protein